VVRGALAHCMAERNVVSVVDLGCGTGSNLRALAPVLPERQSWRLVDHDERLLERAAEALTAWADRAGPGPLGLRLEKGSRTGDAARLRADLAQGLDAVLQPPPDLVTAAALLDLVSEEWMARLVDFVAGAEIPLYAALSYDGAERWTPPHPLDRAMLRA